MGCLTNKFTYKQLSKQRVLLCCLLISESAVFHQCSDKVWVFRPSQTLNTNICVVFGLNGSYPTKNCSFKVDARKTPCLQGREYYNIPNLPSNMKPVSFINFSFGNVKASNNHEVQELDWKSTKTRMHCSRMRTARSLTESCSIQWGRV